MSKQRCIKLARRLGAKLIDTGDSLLLEAPALYTIDGDIHERVYAYEAGFDKVQAWQDLFEDLKYHDEMGAFILCPKKASYENCDWCDESNPMPIAGERLV